MLFNSFLKRSLAIRSLAFKSLRFFSSPSNNMPVLDSKVSSKNVTSSNQTSVQSWSDIQNRLERQNGELVLASTDQIEKYVIGLIRGYFRTSYKDGVTLESNLADHGLDSLDAIEISMLLEDELGILSLI